MARVEVTRGSGFPPLCAITGQPADTLIVARATGPGSSPLAPLVNCAVVWIWPLVFCLWFIGPAWLVFPEGRPVELPVSRKALWRIELAKYTTWFLFCGGILAAVFSFIVSEQSSCVGVIGFVAGLAACTGAYVPAIAFRAMTPAGTLRKDPTTGTERIELRRVHPLFATAAVDMQYSRSQTLAAEATLAAPTLPSERTKTAIVLTALAISAVTLGLIVLATLAMLGGPTECR